MRLYPHCKNCAAKQGGFMSHADPAKGVAKANAVMKAQQKSQGTPNVATKL